jgi:putative ATPase
VGLFESPTAAPLAERMRPHSLDGYVGQEHLLGKGKPLRTQIDKGELRSLILWGPPGVGKTTLARLLAKTIAADFLPFSAVLASIKEIKEVMAAAEQNRALGRRTVLFIDEIHRFNRAQQDAFLPYVERGDITLIGATTENPSFEVIAPLLSRARVYALRPLLPEEIRTLLERGLRHLGLTAPDSVLEGIAAYTNGDGRAAFNILELAATSAERGHIPELALEGLLQKKVLLYDKSGEEHYNLISALHKSVRSSDPDAAVYWLARMLEAGEDRMYVARRLVRMAIEDIGLADPRAVEQAIACQQTAHFLGIPEGDQALAQCAIYLAVAPKSDAAYQALNEARATVQSRVAEPVPLHLRNAPTRAMKSWGYGEGYDHAHRHEDGISAMECLPDSLRGSIFYKPRQRGVEERIAERLAAIRNAKAEKNP